MLETFPKQREVEAQMVRRRQEIAGPGKHKESDDDDDDNSRQELKNNAPSTEQSEEEEEKYDDGSIEAIEIRINKLVETLHGVSSWVQKDAVSKQYIMSKALHSLLLLLSFFFFFFFFFFFCVCW